MDKVTIATSSGLLWLTVVSHFALGLIALVTGTIALAVAKGGKLHKQSGIVFTAAMFLTGLLATALYVYQGKAAGGGLFVSYMVLTATTTVKKLPFSGRGLDILLMLFALAFGITSYINGAQVWKLPGHAIGGVPAGMIFFIGTVSLLAAVGDFRMIREGGLRGARRIARHLWRMCFGLFIATGSFFLGQMQFVPKPVRILPLLFVLAMAPLAILIYWMWRVRLRRKLTGLTVAAAQAA